MFLFSLDLWGEWVLYLMFGNKTLRGQLVFAIVFGVHHSECLSQPGLQL